MKKILLVLSVCLLAFASCNSIEKTARTEVVQSEVSSITYSKLVVGPKLVYAMTPSKSIRRKGVENVKRSVVSEALKTHGNADVLLNPEFEIRKHHGIFGSRITGITVTGYPATYTNFD